MISNSYQPLRKQTRKQRIINREIFYCVIEAITLVILQIGVYCFPEADWLLTGYPSLFAKPSSLEITKLTVSWFNLISSFLIIIAIGYGIWYWWTYGQLVRVYDDKKKEFKIRKHKLKECDLKVDV